MKVRVSLRSGVCVKAFSDLCKQNASGKVSNCSLVADMYTRDKCVQDAYAYKDDCLARLGC